MVLGKPKSPDGKTSPNPVNSSSSPAPKPVNKENSTANKENVKPSNTPTPTPSSASPKPASKESSTVCTSKSTPSLAEAKDVPSPSKSSNSITELRENEELEPMHLSAGSRSKTLPPGAVTQKLSNINLDRLKNAKLTAEKAMKARKIFTIQGPYPSIRQSLRKRGWVEKFCKVTPKKSSPRTKKIRRPAATTTTDKSTEGDPENDGDDDDDDDNDDDDDGDDPNDHGEKIPPWEEDNGIYGIMSRIVRNCSPTFIWSVRRDVVDPKSMKKEQMINHYGKAGSFTTKVGLCVNMRNVPWFEQADPDAFFPRCYRLSHDEEKMAFIDDYRMTACINVLKWAKQYCELKALQEESNLNHDAKKDETPEDTSKETPKEAPKESSTEKPAAQQQKKKGGRAKTGGVVPMACLDQALKQCHRYLRSQRHEELDLEDQSDDMTDEQWDQFIQWYYKLVHDGALIIDVMTRRAEVDSTVRCMMDQWPQSQLDGLRNVWMVKPGAKSRGRGIIPYDRLEDMLKLVSSQVVKKEGKYVVQKYIERPFLIHNTKFDIRQWFLVTDWNPLTIWFYKDSYLRFCSKEFTLDNFDETIHLSNNAVQCKYTSGGSQPKQQHCIPDYLMWSSDEFKEHLRRLGRLQMWDSLIYPGMKKAITCALLCTQDVVEYRKSSFELYGADFMLTEDLHPWLIEINCSPCMAATSPVTERLCHQVSEDAVKVVLDRRIDKNADLGQFELAYKQPQVTVPPYIGINLSVEGSAVKKPSWMIPSKKDTSHIEANMKYAHIQAKVPSGNPSKQTTTKLTMTTKDCPVQGTNMVNKSTSTEGGTVRELIKSTMNNTKGKPPTGTSTTKEKEKLPKSDGSKSLPSAPANVVESKMGTGNVKVPASNFTVRTSYTQRHNCSGGGHKLQFPVAPKRTRRRHRVRSKVHRASSKNDETEERSDDSDASSLSSVVLARSVDAKGSSSRKESDSGLGSSMNTSPQHPSSPTMTADKPTVIHIKTSPAVTSASAHVTHHHSRSPSTDKPSSGKPSTDKPSSAASSTSKRRNSHDYDNHNSSQQQHNGRTPGLHDSNKRSSSHKCSSTSRTSGGSNSPPSVPPGVRLKMRSPEELLQQVEVRCAMSTPEPPMKMSSWLKRNLVPPPTRTSFASASMDNIKDLPNYQRLPNSVILQEHLAKSLKEAASGKAGSPVSQAELASSKQPLPPPTQLFSHQNIKLLPTVTVAPGISSPILHATARNLFKPQPPPRKKRPKSSQRPKRLQVSQQAQFGLEAQPNQPCPNAQFFHSRVPLTDSLRTGFRVPKVLGGSVNNSCGALYNLRKMAGPGDSHSRLKFLQSKGPAITAMERMARVNVEMERLQKLSRTTLTTTHY